MDISEVIAEIKDFPDQLAPQVAGLSDEQLTTAYVPGEWTIAQNVYHLADAHMRLYLRFKRAVLGIDPITDPWNPDDWASLPDAQTADLTLAFSILIGVHGRVAALLPTLSQEQWARPAGSFTSTGPVDVRGLAHRMMTHGHEHMRQIDDVLQAMRA